MVAFAGSPYVPRATFVETILELQDLFYEFKNESLEQIPDDDRIVKTRSLFGGAAEPVCLLAGRPRLVADARKVRVVAGEQATERFRGVRDHPLVDLSGVRSYHGDCDRVLVYADSRRQSHSD